MTSTPPTYNSSFFRYTKNVENTHFWYVARREWIYHRLRKSSPPPAKVLEIGCGTGNVSSFLSSKGYNVTGCEFYQEAIDIAWPGFNAVCGDAHDLPFADGEFDVAGLFDVIEHFDNDTEIIKEAARVVRNEGFVIVTVPARKELWSTTDKESLHRRRYSKNDLMNVAISSGLAPVLCEYMFLSLYLPMRFMRSNKNTLHSQFEISEWMNRILTWIVRIEHLVGKVVPLPFGTSLILIARKKDTPTVQTNSD